MNSNIVGQPVYNEQGHELGTVKEVRGGYIKVDARMQPDYWVREGSIQSSGGRYTISGNIEKLDNPELGQSESRGSTEGHTHTSGHTTGRVETEATGTRARGTETENIQLREEQLRVETEREQAGEVRIGKRVTEHEETVTVPVREERVIIERTAGSGQPAEGGELREGETIEVPLMKERVEVEKEAVVSEEVNVRKEVTERQERVTDTVRKEELVVDKGDGLVTDDQGRQGGQQRGSDQGHSHRG